MDSLSKDFDISAKNPSEEAQRRWRSAVMVADLVKRADAKTEILKIQERLRVQLHVQKMALKFLNDEQPSDYVVPQEVKAAGFNICGDELGSLVEDCNLKKLEYHDGVAGIANKLSTSTTTGLSTDGNLLNRRKEIFGINKFTESQQRSFWVYVWEALQDLTLMILGLCAFLSLIVGLTTEGWPEGAHYGLGIVASIMLVVIVMAISDYRQYLQFRDLEKEKKSSIQVTRNGCQQKMSIYDLLPGDIVHLSIGDEVPADGLFVSGFSVEIDESSLTGKSEPVMVTAEHPFLLSGTKVQDGSCTMMITTVGMRTLWGKLMATLSEGRDDEIPLQKPRKSFYKASLLYDQLHPVWPGLNFWYYLAIISSPSWVFSFLAMDFIKRTAGLNLTFIFIFIFLILAHATSTFVLSRFYFLLPRNQETNRFFRRYKRAGKTIGYVLLFFSNVGLYYFSEKSVACMLTFLSLAFYCLCTLFCIQPYTDFGVLEFLLSACMNQTSSLFGLRSSYSWLVIIACIVIAGIRFCLEPVPREATTDEDDLESGIRFCLEPVPREATTNEDDLESTTDEDDLESARRVTSQ